MIDIILHGIPWRDGYAGPYMPAFADILTDDQLAALAAYVRARYTNHPAWQSLAAQIHAARAEGAGE